MDENVEYEEKEDEFDIASHPMRNLPRNLKLNIHHRRMRKKS